MERLVLAGGNVRAAAGVTGAAALASAAGLVLARDASRERLSACAHVLVACVACLLGCVLAVRSLAVGERFADALRGSSVSGWEFAIASDGTPATRGGYRCRARARADGLPQGDVWLESAERLERGSHLVCVGRFLPQGDDDWSRTSRMQGVWGTVRVVRVERLRAPEGALAAIGGLRARVLESLGPEERAERGLLAGCVCGSRESLRSFGLDELFSRCGVAHLVAVSGGHLAILASLVSAVLEHARLRPHARFAVLTAASGVFVLLCGAPVSAVRAWAMTVIGTGGMLVGRRAHALSGVSVVGLAMALLDPTVSGQLGFVLSVASVCGLCVYAPYAGYVLDVAVGRPVRHLRLPRPLKRRIGRAERGLRAGLAASMVAQLVTLPLVVEAFGQLSLLGPLASALVSAPFTCFVGLGLVAACLWWIPALQGPLLAACDLLGALIVCVLRVLAALPHATVVVTDGTVPTLATVALLLGVIVLWPTVSRKAMLAGGGALAVALACLFARWRYLAPACVRVLDVGQGDAILVQDGAAALLVDAGPDQAVAQALARGHVLHLDALLITHLHADHYGGIADLVGTVPCERVLVARGVGEHVPADLSRHIRDLTGAEAVEVAYGEVIRVGEFDLEVVWPLEPVDGDENADSIELALSYDHDGRTLTALLTGDAERDETGSVLARGDVGDVDLLKVGHHGSEVSLTSEEARALSPEVAVASAGEGNSYGHPRRECVEMLVGAGSEFLCTKDAGDVEVRPGERGPVVIARRQ